MFGQFGQIDNLFMKMMSSDRQDSRLLDGVEYVPAALLETRIRRRQGFKDTAMIMMMTTRRRMISGASE